MEKITGKNNDIIKGVKKLLTSSNQRRAQSQFVLEGARLVFDVLNSFVDVDSFFITESAYAKYRESADLMIEKSNCSYFISDEISSKISETKNSQGIFAICNMSSSSIELNPHNKYIALDNIQDPGNLGTIIRTAEALGIDGIIIGGGCDLYNPKVLRASMGSFLRIKYMICSNLHECLNELRLKNSYRIYSTSPSIDAVNITKADFSKGCICVIGNEANGVSDAVLEVSDEIITIPMLGRAESLNASIAASIVMWEMLR